MPIPIASTGFFSRYALRKTHSAIPYGAVIADLGTPTTGQPYKFAGKELITANGLNEYDFGARQYYSAVPAFTSIDLAVRTFLIYLLISIVPMTLSTSWT